MTKLKPCPFCGSTDIFVHVDPHDGADVVECWDCNANIASLNSKSDAIRGWNKRAKEGKK